MSTSTSAVAVLAARQAIDLSSLRAVAALATSLEPLPLGSAHGTILTRRAPGTGWPV